MEQHDENRKNLKYKIDIADGNLYVFEWEKDDNNQYQWVRRGKYYYEGGDLISAQPLEEQEEYGKQEVFKKFQLTEAKKIQQVMATQPYYRDIKQQISNFPKGEITMKKWEKLYQISMEAATKFVQLLLEEVTADDYLNNKGSREDFLEKVKEGEMIDIFHFYISQQRD